LRVAKLRRAIQAHRVNDRIRLEPSGRSGIAPLVRRARDESAARVPRRAEKAGKEIYPVRRNIFAALNATPFDEVKVVILARIRTTARARRTGSASRCSRRAAAAVARKHLHRVSNATSASSVPDHGCLLPWAKQGVLLLNAVLTVERGTPPRIRAKAGSVHRRDRRSATTASAKGWCSCSGARTRRPRASLV
jgi:hypothetical protein